MTGSEQTYSVEQANFEAHFLVGWFLQTAGDAELRDLLEVCEASGRTAAASWVRAHLRSSS
jgi:hypothetical protein